MIVIGRIVSELYLERRFIFSVATSDVHVYEGVFGSDVHVY